MGKRKGAKVIAIAGSAEKCEWLEKDLGVDKAINYKRCGPDSTNHPFHHIRRTCGRLLTLLSI